MNGVRNHSVSRPFFERDPFGCRRFSTHSAKYSYKNQTPWKRILGGRMARTNFEDDIYTHEGFPALLMSVKNIYLVKGYLVHAWELAQKYWLEHHAVPFERWPEELKPLIETGFARIEERPDGAFVYVAGSRERFAFLDARSEAGKKGGEASAKARKPREKKPKASKSKQATATDSKIQQVHTNEPSGSLSLSGSESLSLSGSESGSGSEDRGAAGNLPSGPAKPNLPSKDLNAEAWAAYADEYEKKYRVTPVRNRTINGQVANLVQRLGADAPAVARFYVQHPKKFYAERLHPFGACLADAESLRTQWALGRAVTDRDVKRYADNQDQLELQKRIAEGSI